MPAANFVSQNRQGEMPDAQPAQVIRHLILLVVLWSDQNEGFVTLLGCLLGIPSVFYTGWSIRTYVTQKKKDDVKEQREKAERAHACS